MLHNTRIHLTDMPASPRPPFPALERMPPVAALLAALLAALPAAAPQVLAQPSTQSSPQATPAEAWLARAGQESRSKNFRILSDLKADETRAYADHLDLFSAEYTRVLSGIPQRTPELPLVLMCRSESDYHAVLRDRYGIDARGRTAIFFTSRAGSALAFFVDGQPRMRVLHALQHEAFHQHAFLRFAGSLPPWVDEGLAETYGGGFVVDGRVAVGLGGSGAVTAVQQAIEQETTLGFARLLTMSEAEWKANERPGAASVQRLQTASLVQFLGWGDGGRHARAFERYLGLLHAGTPSEQAFVTAFGTNDVGDFERAWRRWALALRPSAFDAAALRLRFLAEGLRTLARDGIAVTDLDGLLAELRERKFTVELAVHGHIERLSADDAALELPPSTQPSSASQPPRPTIELVTSARPPAPPTLSTRGLSPRELVIKWTRSARPAELDFELVSAKPAPLPPPAQAPRRPGTTP